MIEREGRIDGRGYSGEDFLKGVIAGIRLNDSDSVEGIECFRAGLEAAVKKADELGMPLGFACLMQEDIIEVIKQNTRRAGDGSRRAVLSWPNAARAEAYLRSVFDSYGKRKEDLDRIVREFREVGRAFVGAVENYSAVCANKD